MQEEAFVQALAAARRNLAPVARPDRPLRALAAAGFFALCALVFAAAAILAPANVTTPPARISVQ